MKTFVSFLGKICLSRVRVVVDYADTRFLNFVTEYLRENETFRKTVFACSYCAQVEYFKQQKMVENLVTLSLKSNGTSCQSHSYSPLTCEAGLFLP